MAPATGPQGSRIERVALAVPRAWGIRRQTPELHRPVDNELRVRSADAIELALPVAGVGSRSLAFIIDWHVRTLVSLAWLVSASVLGGTLMGLGPNVLFEDAGSLGGALAVLALLPPALVYLLYHPVLEILMAGRTPGKRMVGIRIVATNGQTPGAGPLLLRNLFRLVDSLPLFYALGLLVVVFTRHQVRIGDLAAGTLLVHEQRQDARALQTLATETADGLDQRDRELLLELIERWQGLEPEARIRLGRKMLDRHRGDMPPGLSGRELEDEILRRLRDLSGRGLLHA